MHERGKVARYFPPGAAPSTQLRDAGGFDVGAGNRSASNLHGNIGGTNIGSGSASASTPPLEVEVEVEMGDDDEEAPPDDEEGAQF